MRPRATTTSLAALYAFTSASNLATAVATIGIFFLTESAFGFSTSENYLLGLLLGATYGLAAWKAAPLVRVIAALGRRSSRGALALLVLALAGFACLPGLLRAPAAIYLFVLLYTPTTGVLWPLVESFLSGGKRAASLRGILSSFNVIWSSSAWLALLLVAPLVQGAPFEVFLGLAVVHLASLAFLYRFGPQPERHLEGSERAPQSYRALLGAHRILLVASYLVMFALAPLLPELGERLGLSSGWRVALGSLWMGARVGGFWVLGRWQAWHGRAALAWVGAGLLAAGFGGVVLAPGMASSTAALTSSILAQLVLGLGLAALYTANLYYSLEVGEAAVEAGGSHEGLIGLGYTLGPLCGCAASALVWVGAIEESALGNWVLALVVLLVLGAVGLAARKLLRSSPEPAARLGGG